MLSASGFLDFLFYLHSTDGRHLNILRISSIALPAGHIGIMGDLLLKFSRFWAQWIATSMHHDL